MTLLQGLGDAYYSRSESVEKSLFLVLNASYFAHHMHEVASEPSPWQGVQLLRERGLGYDHSIEFIDLLEEQRDLLVTMLLVRGGFGDLLALRSEAQAQMADSGDGNGQAQVGEAFADDPQRAHHVEGVLDGQAE